MSSSSSSSSSRYKHTDRIEQLCRRLRRNSQTDRQVIVTHPFALNDEQALQLGYALRNNTVVDHVVLSLSNLSVCGIQSLLEYVRQNATLQSFELLDHSIVKGEGCVTAEIVHLFINALASRPFPIAHLSLTNTTLSLDSLAILPNLSMLSLVTCHYEDGRRLNGRNIISNDAGDVPVTIQKPGVIERLVLRNVDPRLTVHLLRSFIQPGQEQILLAELHLSTRFTAEVWDALGHVLTHALHLRVLILSLTCLDRSNESFWKALETASRSLQVLKLDSCTLQDPATAVMWCNVLRRNTTLQHLHLCSCRIEQTIFLGMLRGLRNNMSIQQFSCWHLQVIPPLSHVSSFQSIFPALCHAVHDHPTLQRLELMHNNFSSCFDEQQQQDFVALAQALSVRHLEWSACSVTPIDEAVRALSHSQGLETLTLQYNPLRSAESVIDLLQKHDDLRELTLLGCNGAWEHEPIKDICRAMRPTLQAFSYNPLSLGSWKSLCRQLPSHLTRLTLSCSNLSLSRPEHEEAFDCLLETVAHNMNLIECSIRDCAVMDQERQAKLEYLLLRNKLRPLIQSDDKLLSFWPEVIVMIQQLHQHQSQTKVSTVYDLVHALAGMLPSRC